MLCIPTWRILQGIWVTQLSKSTWVIGWVRAQGIRSPPRVPSDFLTSHQSSLSSRTWTISPLLKEISLGWSGLAVSGNHVLLVNMGKTRGGSHIQEHKVRALYLKPKSSKKHSGGTTVYVYCKQVRTRLKSRLTSFCTIFLSHIPPIVLGPVHNVPNFTLTEGDLVGLISCVWQSNELMEYQ